jgi:integrase
MAAEATREAVRTLPARVKALRPGPAMFRTWDSVVSGFHVRVYPTSSKSYAVQFQRPGGAKVQVTIGSSDVFSAEDAREQARKLREVHDSGQDARAHMMDKRNAKDVAALVKLWEENYRDLLKPSTRRSHDSLIKGIVLALGKRLVKDLDRPTIKALYRKEKKIHPTGANRMVEVLSRLMNIAEEEGWRPLQTNPCFRFPKVKEPPCQRVLSAVELGRLESSVAALVDAGKLDAIAADLIRFLALSGLRTGEAGGLMWTDMDLDRGAMVIRDHKTSKTVGPKHLPLNGPLRVVLQRRAGQKLGKLVFPGLVKDKPIQGLRHMWLRVLAVPGCDLEDVTPHDLRRTFMTATLELGYPAAIGDTLLGHSLGKIRDTYTNLSMEGILSTASEETAQWIAAALRGENPKPGSKVTTHQDAQTRA